MNKRFRLARLSVMLCFTFLGLSQVIAAGLPFTSAEKIADFDALTASILAAYAPLHYKANKGFLQKPAKTGSFDKDFHAVDWDTYRKVYRSRISKTKNNKEFYQMLSNFVAGFKDGHFNIHSGSRSVSGVPMVVMNLNGKPTFLRGPDPSKYPPAIQAPFLGIQAGDEVLSIDGVSVEDEIIRLSRSVSWGSRAGLRSVVTGLLFLRPIAYFPEGQFKSLTTTVEFMSRATGNVYSKDLPVLYRYESADALDGFVPPVGAGAVVVPSKKAPTAHQEQPKASSNKGLASSFFADELDLGDLSQTAPHISITKDWAAEAVGVSQEESMFNYSCNPVSRIPVPQGATMVVPHKPFTAYYYPTSLGNVGYIRIPHYLFPNGDVAFAAYQFAVREMKANTVALILDQDHNCGGSVGFAYKFVSLFIQETIETTKFSFRASRIDYKTYSTAFAKYSPFNVFYKVFENFVTLLKTHWENGDRLTDPTNVVFGSMIKPDELAYDKPILMLIDSRSGSGGDAVPSLLQSSGVTLLGTTTAGLGGHIGRIAPLPTSQLKTVLTKSLFYRHDGVAIENNGVVPDINYEIGFEDIQSKFVTYKDFYTEKVLDLVSQNP